MSLWRFAEPFDHRFARASRVGGTWQGDEYKSRTRNILIEWEPDSDVVGDFTWPGLDTDLIVTDRVGKALCEAGVEGFDLRPVEMQENCERAKRCSNKPSVKLPYKGPTLRDFWITAWTTMDRERSTVREVVRDDESRYFELIGAQQRKQSWDQQRNELVSGLIPRTDGQGLFVREMRGVFRVEEFPAWIFCTDDVKALVEESGFTNVTFLEMGDVRPRPSLKSMVIRCK